MLLLSPLAPAASHNVFATKMEKPSGPSNPQLIDQKHKPHPDSLASLSFI